MKVSITCKSKDVRQKHIIVTVNRKEAGRLISSLGGQLGYNDPNHRLREDFTTENGEVFIIFVERDIPEVDKKFIKQAKWFEGMDKKKQEKWKKEMELFALWLQERP